MSELSGDGARVADLRPHLQALLREEHALLTRLDAILREETAIVSGSDVAAIEQVGQRRHAVLSGLLRIGAERESTARSIAGCAGADGFESLLKTCDANGSLRRQWLGNLDMARRCREHNERNGAIVGARLGTVRRLLGAMRGADPNPAYGPAAERGVKLRPRELGMA